MKIISGAEASAPVLKISGRQVEFEVGSAGPTGTVDAMSVELVMSQSTLKVSEESLKIDGRR